MLDIQLQKLLEGARQAGVPDLADLPPPVAREVYRQIVTSGDLPVADVHIEDRAIPGPGGELPLRIYRPKGEAQESRGVVLFIHGGGFVVGRPADYDGVCSTICAESGCVIVQPDYRLAPEHPFPAAVDDCYAALCWLAEHAGAIGGDPQRIAVAGDSAGANLATVMAILARDRKGPKILQQTLIYPVVAPQPEMFDSYARYGEGLTLTTRTAKAWIGLYLGDRVPTDDFRAAPLLAADLGGLPPALVLVAGHDVLHDEGIAYAGRLLEAGNQVSLVEYGGLAHGFISMGGAIDAARLAVTQVATALGRALAA